MDIVIAGGTDFLGRSLCEALQRGPHVTVLTRRPAYAKGLFGSRMSAVEWDAMTPGFQQLLTSFPRVVEGSFRTAVPASREPDPERERLFCAWPEGRTGFPVVDGGMRQLNRTGWMPNRERMIVASFLVKDLQRVHPRAEEHACQVDTGSIS
ncbi:MAG: FAD-binding domain-containing protein [Nitrospira sp.]|nr:FAD-binding domain-containing protein [Nitrospira sp.]